MFNHRYKIEGSIKNFPLNKQLWVVLLVSAFLRYFWRVINSFFFFVKKKFGLGRIWPSGLKGICYENIKGDARDLTYSGRTISRERKRVRVTARNRDVVRRRRRRTEEAL